VIRDGAVLSFFLAGKQHNEPFSREISRWPRPFWPLNCPLLCSGQFRGQKGRGHRKISLENIEKGPTIPNLFSCWGFCVAAGWAGHVGPLPAPFPWLWLPPSGGISS
jgi:hypothetical protein